ncbi:hypothetical protein COCC4DRAFT_58156 [Bipolaris maydis ATCC 48331]|uniref:Uncharacterized protein n=2 Tax=Cochliobolus heterostrophus TaxID=5016 RepID=M2UXQ0_COCH5|nr:uncharacterized protein COCC4DRAFT_58156 [Bipolaris maydis ATCC 48331]EMD92603.1 hypothetical protein COCHEDRAFT_1098725 [Bipolaris maydis C5]ENI08299.1 hypothetical protein COCC4DRAFT_58156 [Bipolaris maydis ATCC 48331]
MASYTDFYTFALLVVLKSSAVGKTTLQVAGLAGVRHRPVHPINWRTIVAGFGVG